MGGRGGCEAATAFAKNALEIGPLGIIGADQRVLRARGLAGQQLAVGIEQVDAAVIADVQALKQFAEVREAQGTHGQAGELAVGVFARMCAADWLSEEGGALKLTASGEQGLQALGIDLHQINRQRRQRLCACPDWSERKPHLGGALGAALLNLCEGEGWLRRSTGSRALQVSPKGRRAIMAIAAS